MGINDEVSEESYEETWALRQGSADLETASPTLPQPSQSAPVIADTQFLGPGCVAVNTGSQYMYVNNGL